MNRDPSATILFDLNEVTTSAVVSGLQPFTFKVQRDGHEVTAQVRHGNPARRRRSLVDVADQRIHFAQGEEVVLFWGGEAFRVSSPDYELHHDGDVGSAAITAPMPGRIVAVHVSAGDTVEKGAKLVTLEAMKMEHGLTAPFAGKVAEVPAVAGGQVSEGALLVRLDSPT
jgi:acetyl/propionyl-CoA carboxylase alpha subunit